MIIEIVFYVINVQVKVKVLFSIPLGHIVKIKLEKLLGKDVS
jgi:hypothetical protein